MDNTKYVFFQDAAANIIVQELKSSYAICFAFGKIFCNAIHCGKIPSIPLKETWEA